MALPSAITPIQQADLEYSGNLAQATESGALFSLLLALHFRPANEYLKGADDSQQEVTDPDFPDRLNQYRRPKLNADLTTIATNYHSASLLNKGLLKDLSLHQAMHPDALGFKPEGQILGEDIISNCDYATQQRLKKTSDLDNTLPLDYTKLADIVPVATQML